MVTSSGTGPPKGGFFLEMMAMDIWVYSDESGVFDKNHEEFFVFAGVILLSDDERQSWIRKYRVAENVVKMRHSDQRSFEAKATNITNKEKGKLFRSLNKCYKFATIIELKKVNTSIFGDKKHKQRYLDYAYKIALKTAFKQLICNGLIDPKDVQMIYVFPDEHTTATSGRYELHEALEREFKIGTFNMDYSVFFPPLFPGMKGLQVQYCNSVNKPLVRASDIIANRIYRDINDGNLSKIQRIPNLSVILQP